MATAQMESDFIYRTYILYRKLQKLSESKVLWLTGFHSNVNITAVKTFVGFASSVLRRKPLFIRFIRKTFAFIILSKSAKTMKLFLAL